MGTEWHSEHHLDNAGATTSSYGVRDLIAAAPGGSAYLVHEAGGTISRWCMVGATLGNTFFQQNHDSMI